MRRTVRLVIVLSVLAALMAPAAVAAERMWIGFHDDPSFRWVPNRKERVAGAASTNATIMRLLVQWKLVGKTRPSTPTDSFDSAYNFDDVDEAVRAAQDNDQEVILTISGTPRWANGGKNPNVMPTRVADFTNFARAIASRYSGRFVGYPFVRFFSIWNEPNLQLFLTPQFNAQGKSVAPANYAKLAAAAYTGIKAGNRQALVGIGETSARGSDKPTGLRPTHTPGKFAELVAKANPRLKFDAWTHHPYPFNPNFGPSQRVKWPNVTLSMLPRFDDELKKWFKRKSVPIWITEYGHQTRPEDSLGIPYARQAAYIQQSISMVSRYPFVPMFIWFVYRPGPGVGVGDLHAERGGEEPVSGSLYRERPPARRPQQPRSRATRDAHAADQRAHATLLRDRFVGHVGRNDVARVPRREADPGGSADGATPRGLHDRGPGPSAGRRRARPVLPRHLRVELAQRGPSQPPHHPARSDVSHRPQTSTCIPSHHWGAPRDLPASVRMRRARGCCAR